MRRIIPYLVLAVALAACGDTTADSAATATSAAARDTVVDTTASPPETTAPETTSTSPSTTAVPDETTSEPPGGDNPFEVIAATPPAVFDSYVSTMSIQMGFEDQVFEVTGDGSWTGDAFECTMAMAVSGLEFSQSVVGTADTIWFDDGTGFEESSMNADTESVVASCAGSPSFWEDFVNPGVDVSGETEEFGGRTAVKVDLRELLDYGGGLGMVPEIDDAVVNRMDMWIDEETNVVLGLSAEIAVDPGELGDLGLPGGAEAETVLMTMDLQIDRVNDPTITINIPPG